MTAAVHIPEHATVAHLERLLMRWPCSIRLKLELATAKRREAYRAKKARAKVVGQIMAGLKTADLATLKTLAAELQQLQEVS
jgi:hypothetical protein